MKKVCHNDRNVVKLAYTKPPSTDPRARVGVRAGAGPQPIMAANLEIIC